MYSCTGHGHEHLGLLSLSLVMSDCSACYNSSLLAMPGSSVHHVSGFSLHIIRFPFRDPGLRYPAFVDSSIDGEEKSMVLSMLSDRLQLSRMWPKQLVESSQKCFFLVAAGQTCGAERGASSLCLHGGRGPPARGEAEHRHLTLLLEYSCYLLWNYC